MNATAQHLSPIRHLAAGSQGRFRRLDPSLDQPTITVGAVGGSNAENSVQRWADPERRNKSIGSRNPFLLGDERCVPPTDPGEQLRGRRRAFFSARQTPDENNIHRVHGEAARPPKENACAYAQQIRKIVASGRQRIARNSTSLLLGMVDERQHRVDLSPMTASPQLIANLRSRRHTRNRSNNDHAHRTGHQTTKPRRSVF